MWNLNRTNFIRYHTITVINVFICLGLMSCEREIKHLSFKYFDNTEAEKLAYAVKNENITEIRSILESKPDLVNFQDPIKGNTLLTLAVVYNLKESCSLLLQYGANPNSINSFKNSPMYYGFYHVYAPENCDLTIPKLLINYGGNLNHIDSNRVQTLLMASINGKIEQYSCISRTRLLIESGSDINLWFKDPTQCPVNHAIILGNYEVAEMLLFEYNAEIPEFGVKRLSKDKEDYFITFKELIQEILNEPDLEIEKLESLNRIMKYIESKER